MVEETVCLNQEQMGQLFEKNKRTISEHVRNIFREGELPEESSWPENPDNCKWW